MAKVVPLFQVCTRTHFCLAEETPLDRELQSKELARIMSASPHPVVFLGYVVTKPGAERRTSQFPFDEKTCPNLCV
jgi:hypothetical protein